MLRDEGAAGRDDTAVGGPAVVHTGCGTLLATLIQMGYIDRAVRR